MKTRDAFAFKGFDPTRILQRPIFRSLGLANESDEKILAYLAVTGYDDMTTLEKKHKQLKEIRTRISRLYDFIKNNHADSKKGRLENCRRRLTKKIPPASEPTTAATLSFQAQVAREQWLLGFYTVTVLPKIGDLNNYVVVMFAQAEKALQAEYRRQFGKRLKSTREKAGKSQKEVAEELNLTAAGYAFYERGERELTILAIIRLAQFFEVPTDYLFGLE